MSKKIPLLLLCVSFWFYGCAGNTTLSENLPEPLAYTPPPKGLVELSELIPFIHLEIRYATSNNFTGKPLDGYQAQRAFMLPKPAEALARVQRELQSMGYSLKIWDAYRPRRAELQMAAWSRATGNDIYLRDGYLLADVKPTNRFGHSNGNSVDLTIVDSQGRDLDMGTDFDHFTKDAWTLNATGKVLSNRLLLKSAMEKNGFSNFSREWWHFNYWNSPGPSLNEVIR